tara:strand:+ start:2577 stop:2798 length:222 start_codon:yes stop_codon:yes gene_type:complete
MKIGDLVYFKPNGGFPKGGSLTAVKYFERMKRYSGGLPGIIIEDHGSNFSVIFGERIMVVNKNHLSKVNETKK